jgi:AbrB family looped-hinge helix DNA binding protein
METTRLSTKGQIVLPKALRDSKAWKAGTEFTVEERPEGILLRPKRFFKRTKLEDFKPLKWKGKPLTIKQMDQAIAEAVAESYARSRY